jgi:hypothetical protein
MPFHLNDYETKLSPTPRADDMPVIGPCAKDHFWNANPIVSMSSITSSSRHGFGSCLGALTDNVTRGREGEWEKHDGLLGVVLVMLVAE